MVVVFVCYVLNRFLLLGRCWILYYDHKLEDSRVKNNWRQILNENYENWFEKHGSRYGNLKFVTILLIIADVFSCLVFISLRHLSFFLDLFQYRFYSSWLVFIISLSYIFVFVIFSKFPEFTDLFSIKHELLWITRIGLFGGFLGAIAFVVFFTTEIDISFMASSIEIYFYTSIAVVISRYVVKRNKIKLRRYNTQKLFSMVDQIEVRFYFILLLLFLLFCTQVLTSRKIQKTKQKNVLFVCPVRSFVCLVCLFCNI